MLYLPCYFAELTVAKVSKDFLAQAGDPTATGTGGESVWSYLASTSSNKSSNEAKEPRYFTPEFRPKLKHAKRGTVSMAVAPAIDASGKEMQGGCGSQFFITLGDNVDYLDGKHAVFGHVVEGEDTLEKINEVFVDQDSRPYKDIRIRHVIVLGASLTSVRVVFGLTAMLPPRRPISRSTRPHQTTFLSNSPP